MVLIPRNYCFLNVLIRILEKPEVKAMIADYERSKSKFKQENAEISKKLNNYEEGCAEAGREF